MSHEPNHCTNLSANVNEVDVRDSKAKACCSIQAARLMSRDHKRPIAHTKTDPSPNCNQQQEHIVTCSEIHDVWINEIGSKLDAIDIVRFSTVNQWARHIAHSIKQHNGYATVDSVSKYRDGAVAWPDLRWELKLRDWSQTDTTANIKWCDVASLSLKCCLVSDFSFVEPRRLERFAFQGSGRNLQFDALKSISVTNMLVSCTRLVSLSLEACIDKDDDVEWLVNVIAHHTHLSHLSLNHSYLGVERMKRVKAVLSRMSHITSLDLGSSGNSFMLKLASGNNYFSIDRECTQHMCDCIGSMPNIKTLSLRFGDIRANEAKYLCAALANKHHLTHLDLYMNDICSAGMAHLTPCLTQLPKLVYLDIRNNRVDVETENQLRRLLPHVTKLLV